MIRLKNAAQLDGIRASCRMLSDMFAGILPLVRPGVSTKELDKAAHDYIVSHGGKPAFLGYDGYPASLCTSPDDVVIHGIPDNSPLEEGSVIGLDCGIDLGGFFSDAAITLPVGRIAPETARLLAVTRECLDLAIAAVKPGARVHDISRAVFGHAVANGYGVVRQYCGHGVGLEPHEDPQVPNYVSPGPNPRLMPGMVLALEPMINLGTGDVRVLADDWTVVTMDHRPSAHYEHSIAILPDWTVEVLTSWKYPE